MEHVHEHDSVTVLVVIENHPDLVEEQLNVEAGDIFANLMVHDDLRETCQNGKCCIKSD